MNAMFDKSFEEIAKERAFVEAFYDAYKNGLRNSNQNNLEKLINLKNKYRVENLYDFTEYKKRIQKIPKSMGIAQALVEVLREQAVLQERQIIFLENGPGEKRA